MVSFGVTGVIVSFGVTGGIVSVGVGSGFGVGSGVLLHEDATTTKTNKNNIAHALFIMMKF